MTLELKTTEEVIKLWFHYEQIAMHFNDLIIQYRLQLMGGAGAIGTFYFFLVRKLMNQAIGLLGLALRFYLRFC